ncbi:Subtilase family protein [Clostridium sp. DSM 8431]|uniref:S8 family serine peptidase n=1 Tax=Clostridium sp. DSM 8431 TaxID=1761781 RepID=UPI0008EFB050|nr:S8 family serine peptidase [Clostridium sp. DSM 8431]SFU60773.1 Subtilase family protein [Clostridium sp. DSM 8431]
MSTDASGKIEVTILYGQRFNEVKTYVQRIGGSIEDLGYGFAIVNIDARNLILLAQNTDIQYIELPKSLYLADINSNTSSCVESARNQYNVDGEGVVIGFIDSGIDFTHPAFRNEDGTSRIKYIYDLSTGGNVYNNAQINEALRTNNPYSSIPSNDVTQHGTHVAGIACAGGRIPRNLYGVAPKSSIMMVKSARGNFALSSQIMKGLKFLVDRAYELKMPLVVNLSLSTNDGAHNGSSLLEKYISTIATLERITIVVAAGNEGDADHHVSSNLGRENYIRFNVASDETSVVINLYKSILSSLTLELIAPNSASTGLIQIQEGYKEGVIAGNRYQIYNTGPKPFDLNGEIGISLASFGNYIIPGQWIIILRVTNGYSGVYDMWLPVLEGLNQRTKFLQPKINNTLGIPGTVPGVITVGSYNYVTMRISSFSGRGKVSPYDNAKPDLVAPGEDIASAVPGGGYDRKTGTSMATPHVAGICALMMQWGIIKKNDIFLYGDRLKNYLILGAKRERADVSYPDTSWGYGEVCLNQAFKKLIEELNIININAPDYRMKPYEEYSVGKLFIRKPTKIFHK